MEPDIASWELAYACNKFHNHECGYWTVVLYDSLLRASLFTFYAQNALVISFKFGVGRIPFSDYWPSGVIRMGSQYKSEKVETLSEHE